MNTKEYLLIREVCHHYTIEVNFVSRLHDVGLIKLHQLDDRWYLHEEEVSTLEKVLRLHHDLNVNVEGIDIIFNLLERIDELEQQLGIARERLLIYEMEH
ncbi:MAG: MerR family transcriptional regulator [Saprospiraceae bacterium]|nr:MerR family transcriptional regulator [Saprospiraceae bacterium]